MTAADPCLNGHRLEAPAEAPDDQPTTILENLGPLAGLPGDVRYLPVVGKSPSVDDWNSNPSLWLTAEQVLKERAVGSRWTGIGLLTGQKVGRLCWLDFDGEELDPTTGELLRSASLDFETFFNRSVEQLPPSPINISGRPGRFRALFRVPLEWAEYFHGFSITSSESATKSFEFLYEKAGGKLFHAVVEGMHPDGQGWFYRWKEGCSPAEVEIPDLPAWLIAGLVRHIAKKSWAQVEKLKEKEERGEGFGGGEAGPMDLLSPGQQRRCLRKMEKFWPYRGGEKEGLGSKGHYDVMRRLVLSLWKGIADESTFKLWLVDSDWDLKNDWSGAKGSHPVNGGELLSWVKSLAASDTQAEEVKPWAAAWQIAVENGWKPPSWAKPPRTIDFDDFGIRVEQNMKELRTFIENVEQLDTPAQREMAMVQIKQNTGYKDDELKVMLRHLQDEKNGVAEKGGFWDDVVANAKEISVAVERFLPFSAITMIGADPGVGKSTFLYRLARSVAYGEAFAGDLQTVQGNVLIVQKDESDSNMKQKQMLSGITDPEKRIRVEFNFSKGHFKELRQWIEEHEAKYVFMDSFGSIFGADGDLSDVDAGIVLYGLNEIAARYGCAVVLTHHFRKADKSKGDKRQSVTLGDFFGSTYIAAGTSDAWGLYRDPEAGDEELAYLLKNVKPRSGVAQMGDCFRLLGSVEDLSIQVDRLNAVEDGVSKLREGERLLLAALRRGSSEKPCLVTAIDPDEHNDLQRDTGLSRPTVQRLLNALYSSGRWGIKRRVVPVVGKGKDPMGYWVPPMKGK